MHETTAGQPAPLDLSNLKACLRTRACGALIPVDATTCPECGRRQSAVASGMVSGANRRAARYGEIVLTFPTPAKEKP